MSTEVPSFQRRMYALYPHEYAQPPLLRPNINRPSYHCAKKGKASSQTLNMKQGFTKFITERETGPKKYKNIN